MRIDAIAFTDKGQSWSRRLGIDVHRGTPVMQWAREHFDQADALLFIGACGIAVRAIAPLCKSKTTDPAVVVMDEAGRFVIPLLSGHIGGANELAVEIAARIGAVPVVTTATDVRGITAIDSWAVHHDCAIENPRAIQPVSSALLDGRQVGVMISERTLTPPYPVTLTLRPRTLVIGIGCKRGTPTSHIEDCITRFLHDNGLSLLSVRALSTIDLKADEPGLNEFCAKYGLPLLTYTAQALMALPGVFAHSDFVLKTTGVDCVCERAAVMAAQEHGRLLIGKTRFEGVTLALSGDAAL